MTADQSGRNPAKTTLRYPDGNVLLRNLQKDYPIIAYGKGIFLFDSTGKRYWDASGGALVVNLGHGNTEIVDAMSEQLRKVAYVNGMQFTSQVTEELATRLCGYSKGMGLDRAYFLSSGSEAVESALKFARQLWVERGQPQRSKLIARMPSYHGNTLYALSASGRPHYKKYYGPLLHDVVTVPATYEYRPLVPDYQKDGGLAYARELEQVIEREGPESIYAFIVEPVIGSSAGASVPPPGYFQEVQRICRKHGILIIADEVLCGTGRTGKFFASEHFGLEPDLLVLGKGISGGYTALSAVLVRDAHVREMQKGSGYFMHAQTYLQAPFMTCAGLAVLDYFERHGTLQNATRVGDILQKLLKEKIAPLPGVGFVTGKGMLAGIEFVEEKASKKPYARTKKIAEQFISFAFERGMIFWPNVGQADGVNGDLVMVGPPLNTTEQEIQDLVAAMEVVVKDFFSQVK